MGDRERKYGLTELTSRLGDAHSGSSVRPSIEAWYVRRKVF